MAGNLEMAVGYEMSLQDYLRVIFKRKWIIIICTFTIFVTSIVYTSKLIPRYGTHAKVELHYQSTLASLLTDALLYKGNELATAIQFATSNPVMERAAKELKMVKGAGYTKAALAAAVADLARGVSASGDGQTNFITISYQSDNPQTAADRANAIAKAFSQEYKKRNTSSADEVKRFIRQQVEKYEKELLDAEQEMVLLKQSRKLGDLEPGMSMDVSSAAAMDAEYEQVRSERQQVQRELENASKEKQDGKMSAESEDALTRNPRILEIKQSLISAEMELATKLRDLTPRHPEVKLSQEKVRQLRTQLELTMTEVVNERQASLETRLTSLKSREASLERTRPQVNAVVRNIPLEQLEQAQLQRKISSREKLYTFFQGKLEEKSYDDLVNKDNSIEVVSEAEVDLKPSYPNKSTNSLVGTAIGLMLGFALAFVVEAMDTSIGTIEDVERTTGLAVLGVIPSIAVEEEDALATDKSVVTFDPDRVRTRDIKERLLELDTAVKQSAAGLGLYKPQLITYYDPKSPISEAYRTLRTNVQFKGFMGNAKTLTVTSSGPQEGKTTTLCNLAVTMAQSGQKVLAIGCNLRRPALHKMLGIKKKPGVTDILIGARDWREVVQKTGIENLDAFCSGPIPPNPSELLGSPMMTELIAKVREVYDVVIFDCPPVLPVTDAAVLSSKIDCVLMVYYVNRAAREALLRAKVQLENVGAKILGVVLNHIPAEGRLGYSYYYYHYHYYGESSKDEAGNVLKKKSS